MAYTTKEKVENLYGITIPSSLNAFVASLIAAAKLWIDRYTGTTFEGASEARYYDGGGQSFLDIDPVTAITELLILNEDGSTYLTLTEGADDDYYLEPLNESVKRRVVLRGGQAGRFPRYGRAVKVTGSFGTGATVPADVEYAATKLVGEMYQTRESQGRLITQLRLGDYAASYGPMNDAASLVGVTDILDGYRETNV